MGFGVWGWGLGFGDLIDGDGMVSVGVETEGAGPCGRIREVCV